MHPNVYLRTFWRSNFRPEVFVAMQFGEPYDSRYKNIIEPAIEAVPYGKEKLKAKRVDVSKSGDSILTDIIDGIAHSLMVLADISTIGLDSKTGKHYRNGNVMYEVGLALACRQPPEVLLIRDDHDPLLFDVSTVPHKHMDFTDVAAARSALQEEIVARLREIDRTRDARVAIAVASLTQSERAILSRAAQLGNRKWFMRWGEKVQDAIIRLLDRQLLRTVGVVEKRFPQTLSTIESKTSLHLQLTDIGLAVGANAEGLLPLEYYDVDAVGGSGVTLVPTTQG